LINKEINEQAKLKDTDRIRSGIELEKKRVIQFYLKKLTKSNIESQIGNAIVRNKSHIVLLDTAKIRPKISHHILEELLEIPLQELNDLSITKYLDSIIPSNSSWGIDYEYKLYPYEHTAYNYSPLVTDSVF
jgi:hypothetical protein